MNYHVVIPAAGQGTRMNAGKNKQFIELLGKPVIVHTLEVFQTDPWCQAIVLVVNEKEISTFRQLLSFYGIHKVIHVVVGGRERQESVYNGLKVFSNNKIVLIHDGARPFISHEKIHDLVVASEDKGAAVLAVPVKDTIKKVSDTTVDLTLDRSSLWAIQTPQAFHHAVIFEAHEKAVETNVLGTDDASLVERLGKKVYIVEGDYLNIKLTTKDDLLFAKAILANRYNKR